MISGIGLRSELQQILHNQGLVGGGGHQERGLQEIRRSVWAPSLLPENQESRLPDHLPSNPGVQAPGPHLALMLTNVQMSVHLEHLSCGVRCPAQPLSRKQVQEPEDRWGQAVSTAPTPAKPGTGRLQSPILTCLPPHPGPAAVVAPKPACEHGLCPGMVRWAQGATVGVLRGVQNLSRILPVAGKVLHKAGYPGGPKGYMRWAEPVS